MGQKVKIVKHTRTPKIPKDSIKCNMCKGKGYIKNWHKKKS